MRAVGTADGVRVSWAAPISQAAYITEYTIQYFMPPDLGDTVIKVGADTRNLSISAPGHVGRLFIVRMSASTAGGASNTTDPVYVRSSMLALCIFD